MKLKKLMEGLAWEREPGKPLPTLKDVADKHLKEANPDGTISPNEDKEMKELLEDIESRMEDILYEAEQETRRIGGQFRQPGYKVQIVKLLSKMVEGFSKGERF